MTSAIASGAPVCVVGAGIMGAGIAQVAAQAGHPVRLVDSRAGAAAEARARLAATLDGLAAKGKWTAEEARAVAARIAPAASLDDAAGCALVVEAIVEDLGAKRALLTSLEAVVGDGCVLATNTSSISVTALAAGLRHKGRLVGMHFFNPVPLMKLVEVVSGLHTEPAVAAQVFDLAAAWGKVPVHARSTPGFIVNRIARPYYAEALQLLLERAVAPPALDACFRAAGFRMGPCELMDLIGHDTNLAVTRSVFEANFGDKRYAPSVLQQELVDGGLLGRKSGRGFHVHPAPAVAAAATASAEPWPADTVSAAREVVVHGSGGVADALEAAAVQALESHGFGPARDAGSCWVGVAVDGAQLRLSDGRCAGALAASTGVAELAVFDRVPASGWQPGHALAYAVAPQARAGWSADAGAWLAALGFAPHPVADTPGLLLTRTLAMLVNEAADAVQQGVCSADGADAAMKLGVAYPAGPFEWLAGWSAPGVVAVLRALEAAYGGERYRVSPWLRARAWPSRSGGADASLPAERPSPGDHP